MREAAPSNSVEKAAAQTHLREMMNRKVACVRASAGWESLVALRLDDEFDALPVVDTEGRPIGIVSKTDLLRHTRSDEGEVDTRRGRMPEPDMHVDRHAGITAEDVMTPIVHALPEDAPVSYALALLALERVDHIPIVSLYGAVVGLVSARDAAVWLARELGCIVRHEAPSAH